MAWYRNKALNHTRELLKTLFSDVSQFDENLYKNLLSFHEGYVNIIAAANPNIRSIKEIISDKIGQYSICLNDKGEITRVNFHDRKVPPTERLVMEDDDILLAEIIRLCLHKGIEPRSDTLEILEKSSRELKLKAMNSLKGYEPGGKNLRLYVTEDNAYVGEYALTEKPTFDDILHSIPPKRLERLRNNMLTLDKDNKDMSIRFKDDDLQKELKR